MKTRRYTIYETIHLHKQGVLPKSEVVDALARHILAIDEQAKHEDEYRWDRIEKE